MFSEGIGSQVNDVKESWHVAEPNNIGCPPVCPGLLGKRTIVEGLYTYDIVVCPNPTTLGLPNAERDNRGNGHDVIRMHQKTLPTDKECALAISWFDQ